MDVNNLWAAFMLINTCYLTSFQRGSYLASEGSVGTPCEISSWLELAAAWGKCCTLPLLTTGLFFFYAVLLKKAR